MERNIMQKFGIVVPIFFIILSTTFFHIEIYFEDVLTMLPASDFGVEISVWRIIFEPFLGPLLYFNRSIYALEEIPLALLWIFGFYILRSLVHIFKLKSGRRQAILKRAINLPLLFGICFAIFVLILFIPLPNNVIVNNSQHSVLVTTHAHTEYSHDGLISQKKMWLWHKRNRFDAFFITDHANHKKSLQFAKEQRDGNLPVDPLVMVGQEHSGSNHMSLLGLNGKFETRGMHDKAVIDSVHFYDGAVIINHWFDGKGKEKEHYRDLGADGFEIENVGKDLYYDRDIFEKLKKFCEDNRITMVGGLDFHGYGRVCSLYNAFEIPDWETLDPDLKEQAILQILKNGSQEKIKVLMYKDRPFYTEGNLLFRPFFNMFNYFRTLSFFQVLSWILWLQLFQIILNGKKVNFINMDAKIVLLAGASSLFLLVLAGIYYFKGVAVKGYSEVYHEYYLILGPIGLILLNYVLIVGYFRFIKRL